MPATPTGRETRANWAAKERAWGASGWATKWTGSSLAFGLAVGTIVVWAATGPIFKFSDTWQLVINTGTTIVTFLMVFLIQRAQNKDSRAVHLKLNEIVAALPWSSNRLISAEDLTEDEVRVLTTNPEPGTPLAFFASTTVAVDAKVRAMTEAQWLTSTEPGLMFGVLAERTGPIGERKALLFRRACCRVVWNALVREWSYPGRNPVPPHGINGLPVLTASYGNWATGLEDLFTPNWPWPREPWETASDLSTCVRWITYGTTFGADVAALLRDITGNPFRPVDLDPAWRTGTVLALARGVEATGTFEVLPILADALQDAGCEDRGILDHCRGGGPHMPGCWVVDLTLGRM